MAEFSEEKAHFECIRSEVLFLGVKTRILVDEQNTSPLLSGRERERERESEERRSDHHGLELARRDSEGQGPQEKPEAAIHSEKALGCQASCVKCDDNGECVPSHAHAM